MEDNKFSLFNFDGASDVVIKFLDMIEHTVGWSVKPKGKRRDFEEGLEIYKHGIAQNDSLSDLEKAALYSESRKIIKQYINQSKIIKQALPFIKNRPSSNIDYDWLLLFFEYAKNISNEQIQKIWGIILAEKYNGNDSVNRRLIYCLYMMDAKMAMLFEKICYQTVILISEYDHGHIHKEIEYIPLDLSMKDLVSLIFQELEFSSYDTADLELLEEIGLITYNEKEYNTYQIKNGSYIVINNTTHHLKLDNEKNDNNLRLSHIKFTTVGKTLYKILNLSQKSSLLEGVKLVLKRQDIFICD